MITQFIVNGVIAGSIYALVAISFSLVYSTVRFFHFAHGAIYTLGAYLTFAFLTLLHFSFFTSVLLAIICTGLSGAAVELAVYRPMRKRKTGNTSLLIVSLGLLIVLQNLIALLFGDSTKSIRQGFPSRVYGVLGARITSIQVMIIFGSIALSLLTWALLRFTRVGRRVRAVANDADLSTIIGVNTDRVILLVFAVGSGLAAGAAILISLDTDITPTMGFGALLLGVVAAVVGGIGSVPGSMLGGLLVGLTQHIGVWKLPTQWQDAIVFLILVAFLIARPQGFFGRPIKNAGV